VVVGFDYDFVEDVFVVVVDYLVDYVNVGVVGCVYGCVKGDC